MKNIINIFNFLILLFFKNKIVCLINAPQQYFSFVEFIEKKNIDKSNLVIYIGYCSKNSQDQIKELINNYYSLDNINFIENLFLERNFQVILKFYKFFAKKKDMVICGDYKYYLFKTIYNKCKKVIFLDEGISLLRFQNLYEGNKSFELFSIFKHLNKDNNLNEYDYLKKNFKLKKIEKNKIFLLGCYLAGFEHCLSEEFYLKKINLFAKQNSDSEIYFIPHRNERKYDKNIFAKNVKINYINKPIETYLITLPFVPGTFGAFYSMALINLDIMFKNFSDIKILNLSFDKDEWKSSYHRKNFEEFEKSFKFTNIKNINI